MVVINGRISDASFRRMRRLRPLLGPLFEPVDAFGVQTEVDRQRLLELGVPSARVHVSGNMKFDAAEPVRNRELEERLLQVAAGRPVLIAGSTMPEEEGAVLAAFQGAGGGRRALLVLAPRHPERWESVAGLIGSKDLTLLRRSDLDTALEADVVLLDSMGELAGLYAICRSAFVGGTLVPTGGHNPLEPARFGVAIAAGPSMQNFRAMAEQFTAHDAWERVADAADLASAWSRWLDDPSSADEVGERAALLVEQNRGALERTLAMMRPALREALTAETTES